MHFIQNICNFVSFVLIGVGVDKAVKGNLVMALFVVGLILLIIPYLVWVNVMIYKNDFAIEKDKDDTVKYADQFRDMNAKLLKEKRAVEAENKKLKEKLKEYEEK
jgi:hypothetical protein